MTAQVKPRRAEMTTAEVIHTVQGFLEDCAPTQNNPLFPHQAFSNWKFLCLTIRASI